MSKKERYYFSIKQADEYLDTLGKKIHNCLFMYEEKNVTAYRSIHEIQIQLEGLGNYLDFLKLNPNFNNALTTLEDYLYEEFLFLDGDEDTVKSQLRKCMNIVWDLKKTLPIHMECDKD